MPNSVTIVSPASGETIYLTPTAELLIATDFETAQGGTIARANCSAPPPGGHDGDPFPVSGDGEAEVKIGPHGTTYTYTGVTLTARLQSTNGATTYAQASVHDITLVVTDQPIVTPITVTDPPPPPGPTPPGPPYFFVTRSGLTKDSEDNFIVEPGKPPVKYDPAKHAPKRNREVNPNADLKVAGKVSVLKDSYVSVTLSRKRKKTGLVACYTNPQIPVNLVTGEWSVTIPKDEVGKFKKLRQAIITLFVKGDAEATVSIPLKLK